MTSLQTKITKNNAPEKLSMEKTPLKPSPKPSPLHILMALENAALNAPDRLALKHQAVNHPRQLLDVGHIFWISRQNNKIRISALSSQSDVDKSSPFIQDISHILSQYALKGDLDKAGDISLETQDIIKDKHLPFHYTFPCGYFAPFAPYANRGGLLFTRAVPFDESQHALMTRLAQSYGAMWNALSAKPRDILSRKKKWILSGSALIMCLIGLIPVPMTSLAPAEIVAEAPFIVAAPIDGVVDEIVIAPNSPVKAGTLLATLIDTDIQNELHVTTREEQVAEARLRQSTLTAYIDDVAKRDLAVSQAETALARARTQYALDKLSKTKLLAPKDGLAIFSDPQDWAGRPVATGEAIIEIADPSRILLKIDAPLLAGEQLRNGTRVRVFMDADPLKPLEAKIERASYYAAPTDKGQMAFETYARLSSPYALPRIGARGVAKIHGDTAPLIFWLLRRPIAAVRQFIGF